MSEEQRQTIARLIRDLLPAPRNVAALDVADALMLFLAEAEARGHARGVAEAGAKVQAAIAEMETHRNELRDHVNETEPAGATFCGGRALGVGEAIDVIAAALKASS